MHVGALGRWRPLLGVFAGQSIYILVSNITIGGILGVIGGLLKNSLCAYAFSTCFVVARGVRLPARWTGGLLSNAHARVLPASEN